MEGHQTSGCTCFIEFSHKGRGVGDIQVQSVSNAAQLRHLELGAATHFGFVIQSCQKPLSLCLHTMPHMVAVAIPAEEL